MTFIPLLMVPGALDRLGGTAAIPVSAAAFAAVAVAAWKLLWPVTREEWRRVTRTDEIRRPVSWTG